MKKIVISFVIMSTIAFSSAITDNIDDMVDKIRERRVGIDMKELSSTPDPFVMVSKVDVTKVVAPRKKDENIELAGIVNQKAFLNGKWCKVGDEVGGYTLNYIGRKGVVLVDGKRIKKLFSNKKIKGIITIKEGI